MHAKEVHRRAAEDAEEAQRVEIRHHLIGELVIPHLVQLNPTVSERVSPVDYDFF